MKTFKIEIARSDVDKELAKITSYLGAKGFDETSIQLIDRITTVDEDSPLLDRYWTNAVNVLTEHLREFIVSFSPGTDRVSFTLHLSGAYDDSLAAPLKDSILSFMGAAMTKSWLAITCAEKAEQWEEECRRLLLEISRNLYHRRKPSRLKTRPMEPME